MTTLHSEEERQPFRILVAIGEPKDLALLLAVAVPLARARKGWVTALYVSRGPEVPNWLKIDKEIQDVVDEPVVVHDENIAGAILTFARRLRPDMLFLHWEGEPSRGRYLLGRTLDPVIQNAPCDVAVVKVDESPSAFVERMAHLQHILVPVGGGPNAVLAMGMAVDMQPEQGVTALRVAQQNLGVTAISSQWEALQQAIEPWAGEKRLRARVVQAPGVVEGIVREATAGGYDLVLLGATRESVVDRLLFGNLPQEVAIRLRCPTIIVRQHEPGAAATIRRLRWRLLTVLPQLTLDERVGIYRQVQRSARGGVDFYVMITLSAAIASLGLLLNSPAVIIGAMLIAPLMSTLIGTSLGIVQGDFWLVRASLRTTALGTLAGLLVGALMGLAVPGNRITPEMLARGSPTLMDLAVALGAGGAAAYATARKNVASALPGVAIAVALVPPLATAALAAVSGNPQVSFGASLLFFTNLVAIIAAAALTFMWMGFRPTARQEELRQRTFKGGLLGTAGLLFMLTAVLAVLTINSIHEATVQDRVERALEAQVAGMRDVTLTSWEIRPANNGGIEIEVRVESPRPIRYEELETLRRHIAERLGRPVTAVLDVIQTTRLESR
ncbi:MAG: DUF389 domain-containing protein [Chloroflexi bacterium]|nr:DUF389 domain-containing protein [Chloroflexota bacterium]